MTTANQNRTCQFSPGVSYDHPWKPDSFTSFISGKIDRRFSRQAQHPQRSLPGPAAIAAQHHQLLSTTINLLKQHQCYNLQSIKTKINRKGGLRASFFRAKCNADYEVFMYFSFFLGGEWAQLRVEPLRSQLVVLNSCFGIYKKAKNSLQAVIYYSRHGIIRKKEKNCHKYGGKTKQTQTSGFRWFLALLQYKIGFIIFVCLFLQVWDSLIWITFVTKIRTRLF